MAAVRRIIGYSNMVRLRKRGFTVTLDEGTAPLDTITGETDGLLAKLLPGGKYTVTRLRKLGIRA